MDFKRVLKMVDENVDFQYKEGVLSTESAQTSAVSKLTAPSVQDTSDIANVFGMYKKIEEKLGLESAAYTLNPDTNEKVYDESTVNVFASYNKRLDDIKAKLGNHFDSLTRESGQGSEISQGLRTSMLVNLGRTNQDEFTEEFFPSILTNEINQIVYSYSIASYIKEWKGSEKVLLPVHETLVDTSYLQGNTLRLIPDVSGKPKYLNTNIKNVVVNGTNTVVSAPYKYNTKIDIIDSCVADVSITGVKNNIRTISPTLKLDKLFFSSGETTEAHYGTADEVQFAFPVSTLFDAGATPVYNGKKEDFQIKFGVGKVYSIKLSEIRNGLGKEIFTSYPDAVANFTFTVRTDGNLTTSQETTEQNNFKIVSFKVGDAIVLSGPVFDALMDVLKDVKPAGYSLQTFEANGDVVNEGNVLTLDNDSQTYAIGYKQPLTVKGPVASLYNPKNDMSELSQFITHTGDKASVDGKTLLLDTFNAISLSPNPESVVSGIGNKLIKPIAITGAVNIKSQIANMETSNLENSVKALLLNTIKTTLSKMYIQSNYKAIFKRFYKNRNMRVSVGIDQRLELWLPTGEYQLTPDITAVVVSTPDDRFLNSMILAFTSSEPDRNKDIDILGLGFNAYDTTIVTQVRKTIGGSSIDAVMAFPKYEHIIMCTVLAKIDVSGIDEVFVG